MERMQRVDFYEIWWKYSPETEETFLCEVGIYGDAPSQPEADRIAQLMNGVAHFDRTGTVFVD